MTFCCRPPGVTAICGRGRCRTAVTRGNRRPAEGRLNDVTWAWRRGFLSRLWQSGAEPTLVQSGNQNVRDRVSGHNFNGRTPPKAVDPIFFRKRKGYLMRKKIRNLTPVGSQAEFRLILTTPFEAHPQVDFHSNVSRTGLEQALSCIRTRWTDYGAEYSNLVADGVVRSDVDVRAIADAWIIPESVADDFVEMRPLHCAVPHLRISILDDEEPDRILTFWNQFTQPSEWLSGALEPVLERYCSEQKVEDLTKEIVTAVGKLLDVWTRHLACHEVLAVRQALEARIATGEAYTAIGKLEEILHINQQGRVDAGG
jgi:hypothetical protein